MLYYANENLEVRCSTNPPVCYKITDKRICVGHYVKVFDANRSNYSTAFDFRNVAPQSVEQNIYHGGNEESMAKWIEKTHGEGTCDELNKNKHLPHKLDKFELNLVSKHYLKLFKELLKQRGIENPWKK